MKSANRSAAFGCGAFLASPTACGRPTSGSTATQSAGAPLFARHRFEFRRIGLDRIEAVASAPRLGDRALKHLLAARAPKLDLDAVFLREGLRERSRFRGLHRRIEGERAFLAGRLDQP